MGVASSMERRVERSGATRVSSTMVIMAEAIDGQAWVP